MPANYDVTLSLECLQRIRRETQLASSQADERDRLTVAERQLPVLRFFDPEREREVRFQQDVPYTRTVKG